MKQFNDKSADLQFGCEVIVSRQLEADMDGKCRGNEELPLRYSPAYKSQLSSEHAIGLFS